MTPQSSTTFSIRGQKKLSKTLSVSSEYARTAFTSDTDAPNDNPEVPFSKMLGTITPLSTTGYFNAFKSNLTLNLAKFNLSLNHEWVDPGYRTLGALFFHDDFQNLTTTLSIPFKKWNTTIALNGGLEQNNLRNTKLAKDTRLVGSAMVSLSPQKGWMLGANLTNHRSTNRLRTSVVPVLAIDTIVLVLSNKTANAYTTYSWGGTDISQAVSFMFYYNSANTINNGTVERNTALNMYNTNFSYTYGIKEQKLNLSVGINTSKTVAFSLNRLAITPTIGVAKAFEKIHLNARFHTGYSRIITNNVLSSQLGLTFNPFKKHSFSLNSAYIRNFSRVTTPNAPPDFSEISVSLNYGFSF